MSCIGSFEESPSSLEKTFLAFLAYSKKEGHAYRKNFTGFRQRPALKKIYLHCVKFVQEYA